MTEIQYLNRQIFLAQAALLDLAKDAFNEKAVARYYAKHDALIIKYREEKAFLEPARRQFSQGD